MVYDIQAMQTTVTRLGYLTQLDNIYRLRTGDNPSKQIRDYWKSALAEPSDAKYLALVDELSAYLDNAIRTDTSPAGGAPVAPTVGVAPITPSSSAEQVQALSRHVDIANLPADAQNDLAAAYANNSLSLQQIETYRNTLVEQAAIASNLPTQVAQIIHTWISNGFPVKDAITYADELGTIPANLWPAMPDFLRSATGNMAESPMTLIAFAKDVAGLAQTDPGTVLEVVKQVNAGTVNAGPMGALLQQLNDLLSSTNPAADFPLARQFLTDTLQRTLTDASVANNWKMLGLAYAIDCLDQLGYTPAQLSQPDMLNAVAGFLGAIRDAQSFTDGIRLLDSLMGEQRQLKVGKPAEVAVQANKDLSALTITFSEPVKLGAVDADGNGIPDDLLAFSQKIVLHGRLAGETKLVFADIVSAYVEASEWHLNLSWPEQPASGQFSLGGFQDVTGDALAISLMPITLIGSPTGDFASPN